VTEDHERIDELLAGYVLLSLSGEDAAEADRILVDHVPSCATCRATSSNGGRRRGNGRPTSTRAISRTCISSFSIGWT